MITLENYIQLAKNRDIIYPTQIFKRANSKSQWQCKIDGYVWEASYSTIQRGHGCPKCKGVNKKTIIDYEILAKNRGFKILNMAKNIISKSLWKCSNNHIWETKYNNIKNGNGCPFCSGRNKKIENDYLEIAKKNNIKYIGPFPNSTHHKTNWECGCGNNMYKAFNVLLNNRSCCKKCGYKKISGKNSKGYNSNLTDEERLKKRNVKENMDWKKEIYKKFGYKCQKCGNVSSKSNPLNAHHIFNWNHYPKLRFNLKNGICLCQNCHTEFHRLFGMEGNDFQQLNDFLPNIKESSYYRNEEILIVP